MFVSFYKCRVKAQCHGLYRNNGPSDGEAEHGPDSCKAHPEGFTERKEYIHIHLFQ